MEVRDPVHGFISYDELEEKLLNSRVVQRLRGIKQLAMCYLVYPGALHTRFDHSLGVMYVAGQMAERLGLGEKERRFVRIAGLLHDVGHAPFSHVGEQVLCRLAGSEAKTELGLSESENQYHEALGAKIIKEQLGRDLPEELKELSGFFKKGSQHVMRAIIDGPLDADKLDYLLRDSYFTGVRYGLFDFPKVLESLVRVEIGGGRWEIGIEDEGVHAAEQLLLARYHMQSQVYFHRVRRITDAMLLRAIELSVVEEEIREVKEAFLVEKFDLDLFLSLDDSRLMEIVLSSSCGSAKQILLRLKRRHLWKEMFEFDIVNDYPDVLDLEAVRNITPEQTKEAEEYLAKQIFETPAVEVMVDKQTQRSPAFRNPLSRMDPTQLVVVTKRGPRKAFGDVSQVFSNPVSPVREYLYVYAPFEGTRQKRMEFSKNHRDRVRKAIVEIARGR